MPDTPNENETMASAMSLGAAPRQVERLFQVDRGTIAGLDDAALWERFVIERDEVAFAALVARHGPMVLATARGIVGDHHAAEDVFQTTFVALARRGGTIRRFETLGPWLHRVASRGAIRLRGKARRQIDRERRAEPRSVAAPATDQTAIRAAVHAELDRLPASYRLPLVLCDLEGWTKASAAAHLGWTEGTVRGRLERGRSKLRDRLTRQGFAPAAGTLAVLLNGTTEAAAASGLVIGATRAALAVGRPGWTWGTVAAQIGSESIRRSLVGFGLAGSLTLAGAIGWNWLKPPHADRGGMPPAAGMAPALPERVTPPPARVEPPTARPVLVEPADELVPVRILVTDAADEPASLASVRLRPHVGMIPRPAETVATPKGAGQFALAIPRRLLRVGDDTSGLIVASLPGSGVGYFPVGIWMTHNAGDLLSIKLSPDTVPLSGRIVDRIGQPVAGASVRVSDLYASPGPDLNRWADRVRRAGTRGAWEGTNTRDLLDLGPFPDLLATTDADGRFRLVGLGVERVANLVITAPGSATIEVAATTQDRGPIVSADQGEGFPSLTFHPAHFEVTLPPGRSVVGTIRDADTNAPIAGLPVQAQLAEADRNNVPLPGIETITDAQGHYRLDGLPMADGYQVYVRPRSEQPYLNASIDTPKVADLPPGQPVTADLTLRAGVMVRGRITDKVTGQPVFNASVCTYTFRSNPAASRYPGLGGYALQWTRTDADGRYEVATIPGPGLMTVRALAPYQIVQDFAAIPGYDAKGDQFRTLPGFIGDFRMVHALVPIDPAAGTGSTQDVVLDPGGVASGAILDPAGQPLAETTSFGLNPSGWPQAINRLSSYEAKGLNPAHPRHVFFYHEGRKLAGSVILRGDEPGPVPVRLVPWGNITGRLVRANGQPFTDLSLIGFPYQANSSEGRFVQPLIQPDADGRFRFEGTIPGLRYSARPSRGIFTGPEIFQGLIVEPGQTRDLGDIITRVEE